MEEKILKKIEKIKEIVNNKWFCIIEINNSRNIEFLFNLNKKLEDEKEKFYNYFICFFFSSFILIGLGKTWYILGVLIMFLAPIILIFLKPLSIFQTFLFNKNLKKIWWLKNRFIIIFEDNVFIDKQKYPIKYWNLSTNKRVMDFLFTKWEDYEILIENLKKLKLKQHFKLKYLADLEYINSNEKKDILKNYTEDFLIKDYYLQNEKFLKLVNKFNFTEKRFSKFYDNIFILENETRNLIEIKNNLEKNISENKDFFAKPLEIENGFKNISKKINIILKKKNEIFIFLKKYFKEEEVFEKYIFWLKKQIISPLNSMKNILIKNLKYCDYLIEKNKNLENEQIKISNKRLEIQKDTLKKQIFILEEKIKILEK